jgi:hypothetical protein
MYLPKEVVPKEVIIYAKEKKKTQNNCYIWKWLNLEQIIHLKSIAADFLSPSSAISVLV